MPESLHPHGASPVPESFPRLPPVNSSAIRPAPLLETTRTQTPFRMAPFHLLATSEPPPKPHFPWMTPGTTCVNSGFSRNNLQKRISERDVWGEANINDKGEEEEIEINYSVHGKRPDT